MATTPTACAEAKRKTKTNRKAMKQAAVTRKFNRQKRADADAIALVEARGAAAAAVTFWNDLKERMKKANERRRAAQARLDRNTLEHG